ncbi:MAG: sulfur-carrier protein adenylyltransferase/sulfurtransferase [Abditibacteriota bacterium]|nr:sulfur-carrier protein adenylyltransferase/sulfurtransferase [Abditibacteriota bacterium]
MMTNEQVMRYGRHLIMPEMGVQGQEKLIASKILMVGAGGLGSPSALYLAASGVGEMTIIDPDVVDLSNLQRQILHSTSSVGMPKVESAAARIKEVNPNVKVNAIQDQLSNDNVRQLVRECDIVVDGTDNFQTRYMVNDACIFEKKLNVYGSIFRFDGQSTVFCAEDGPCYRCLYPEAPPPGMVPSCAEGGVLGILPGIVGVVQATEAIKILIGKGNPLIGRLMLYDALAMKFRELKIRKDPNCPVCGPNPTITELQDYDYFCGIGHSEDGDVANEPLPVVTSKQLKERIDAGEKITLLDVREPQEWDITHLPNAKLIPLNDLPSRLNELDTADETVVYCHHGMRSARAIGLLQKMGFKKLKNLAGGIDSWAVNVDKDMPRY